jgi:type I restriction enzyme, R subunit
VAAAVSVRTGPNTQQGPIRTDMDGRFVFIYLPAGPLAPLVNAPGFVRSDVRVETLADETVTI